MTDCEELCAPICRARPYCLTLSCTPLEAFQTSLLSCQVTNSLFHLFLPIFFPFLCKQVVWLRLRISGALWNSNHFLYYPLCFLCVKIDATLLQNSFVIIGIIVNAISADLHVDEDEQEASVQRDSSHVDWRHSYGNIYWSSASNLAWNLVRVIRHKYELISVSVQMMWTFILRGNSDSSAVWEAASPSRWHNFPYSRVLVSVKAFYVWHKSAHKA